MPIFVLKLDIFSYNSSLCVVRLPKFSEMLQWGIILRCVYFWHRDLFYKVTRGH